MATIGEIIRVSLHYVQAGGGDIMNVFHFRLAGVSVADDELLQDITEWVVDHWAVRWVQMASNGCTLSHYDADIVTATGEVVRNIGGDIVDAQGTIANDVLPAGNAAYMLAYTAVPKARGSKYVPGISESEVTSGSLAVGYLADLALLLAIYLNPFLGGSGATLQPGVASKVLETFVPFLISGAIDAVVAYQRRRKAGVGI